MSLTATTLSAACALTDLTIAVASATGFNAPTPNVGSIPGSGGTAPYSVVQIDMELMRVEAINGTFITVTRGWNGTTQSAHVSGAAVNVGLPTDFVAQSFLTSRLEAGTMAKSPSFFGGNSEVVTKFTASGAIPVPIAPGTICISGSSVLAMTVAKNPVAGSPESGGEDGNQLTIFNDTAAKNHTVTFQTNGIQGSLHVITMSSTASTFSAIQLSAFNGTWIVTGNYNCTLS